MASVQGQYFKPGSSRYTDGAVIVPDMTELAAANYTHVKTSFARYKLAIGGAIQLSTKKNKDGSNAVDKNGKASITVDRNASCQAKAFIWTAEQQSAAPSRIVALD